MPVIEHRPQRILVTGAGGFVGRALAAALDPRDNIILSDLDRGDNDRIVAGDLSDRRYLDTLCADPIDLVFHLASLPGGAAEDDPDRGAAVNLQASLAIAEAMARQARQGGPVARMVFASTVAVYGELGSEPVTDATPAAPKTSYGAHKQMVEIALADWARRGWLDARTLRLPGIVARPRGASGFGSAFMSDVFHAARAHEDWVCPVSRAATAWWISTARCIDMLCKAATLDAAAFGPGRVLQVPALHVSVGAVIDALGTRLGNDAVAKIRHAPDARIEALFGRQPPLHAHRAHDCGLVADLCVDELVEAVLHSLPPGLVRGTLLEAGQGAD